MPAKALGLREYSRHRKALGLAGGTLRAVQVAIKSGRLDRSLTKDRAKIRSAAEADAEWAATTHDDRVPLTGPTSPAAAPAAAPAQISPLQEMRARREAADAEMAEIDLAKRKGELVEARNIDERLTSLFVACRTKLLGVVAQARQRDVTLTDQQLALIEELIREALIDLARGHVDDEDDG